MDKDIRSILKYIVAVVAVTVLAVSFFPAWHTVPAGYRGVILEFGKPVGIAGEGLITWIPYYTRGIVDIPVQTLKFEDPHASVASKDLQEVSAKVAVNYHLDAGKIDDIYRNLNIAWEDRVMRPNLQEVIKSTTAKFTAEELITKRPLVQEEVFKEFILRVQTYGIVVEAISIVDFQFSQSFSQAIEQKVTAEQDALKERNKLEIVKNIALQQIAQAEGVAKSEVMRANGSAVAIVLKAQAEAKALQLKREQLNDVILQLEAIKQWDGKLPVFLVASDENGTPFIIDISKIMNQTSTTGKR